MKKKKVESFSEEVNLFVEKIKHHTDVLSIKTRGKITTIRYEDWTDHPRIINTSRKKLPGEVSNHQCPTTLI
jgi:hypothetical protein